MSLTYQNDQSFFMTIFPPFAFAGPNIKKWMLNNNVAKFRYIRDQQCEEEYFNVKQITEYYPGIKTIGLVLNPWTRMVHAYTQLQNFKINPSPDHNIPWDLLVLDSFEDFIFSLKEPATIYDYWFNLSTPQVEWLEQGDVKVDYLFKVETLDEDFQIFKEYFCSDEELDKMPLDNLENREYYTEETKAVVEEVFKADIERFGYEF